MDVPNVSFLRTFGCVGHVKNTKPHLGKLEDRSTPMVLLGFEEGNKAYRLYDPKGDRVVVYRDVVFDEMATWDWEDQGVGVAAGVSSTFAVERSKEEMMALESRLHQQRRIHLHHSPLRRQHRGHTHWSSHHHPPTSTSSLMLSMSAKGELLG